MQFELDVVDSTNYSLEITNWLVANIGPYQAFDPKLNHYQGRNWCMRAIRRARTDNPDFFRTYRWVWEITIDDATIATEFALRFL